MTRSFEVIYIGCRGNPLSGSFLAGFDYLDDKHCHRLKFPLFIDERVSLCSRAVSIDEIDLHD